MIGLYINKKYVTLVPFLIPNAASVQKFDSFFILLLLTLKKLILHLYQET
ncbi:MAG: hypothetical protein RLZZ546_2504 [Bacteroidota bacterium]